MRKAKAGTRGKKTKKVDWDAIRLEWDAGQLDVKLIASHHGVTPQAITNRASRYKWPPRKQKSESAVIVHEPSQPVVINVEQGSQGGGMTVARVLELLIAHRKMYGLLHRECMSLLADLEELKREKPAASKTIKYIKIRADIVAKISAIRARLDPIEKKAFGIMEGEAPNPFELLSLEEQEELMHVFLKWQAQRDAGSNAA